MSKYIAVVQTGVCVGVVTIGDEDPIETDGYGLIDPQLTFDTYDVTAISPRPSTDWTTTDGVDWDPPAIEPTLIEQAQAAIAYGLNIESTGTPAINALYATDNYWKTRIATVSAYIDKYSAFPNNASTFYWPNRNGMQFAFTTTTLFQDFAKAITDYVEALEQIIYTNSGTLPSSTTTIP